MSIQRPFGGSGSNVLGKNNKLLIRNSRIQMPNSLLVRQVMATPPTVTFGNTNPLASGRRYSATQYTSGTTAPVGLGWASVSRSGNPTLAGTGYPNSMGVLFHSVNYGGGNISCNAYQLSTLFDGTQIVFHVKGGGGAILCKVDDQYVTLTEQAIPGDGDLYYYSLQFSASKPRRIDFISYQSVFFGVFTGLTDTLAPAPLRGPRTIIMGDSYTEGTGATNLTSWVSTFGDAMAWDDVWQSAVGGSGYVQPGPAPRVPFGQRFSGDVSAFAPDVIGFAGGINDSNQPLSDVLMAVRALYAQARAENPNAMLFAVSPFFPRGACALTGAFMAMRDGIRSAIQAVDGVFVDLLEMPLPLNLAPQTTTLASPYTVGQTTLSTVDQPVPNATYAFASGDRFVAKSVSGGGPFTVTLDGTMQSNQASGATLTQVGDCFMTGTGRSDNPAGWGNADVYTCPDNTHPTPAGHVALGYAVAAGLCRALAPN